jgi:hypothetical protein
LQLCLRGDYRTDQPTRYPQDSQQMQHVRNPPMPPRLGWLALMKYHALAGWFVWCEPFVRVPC